MQFLLALTWIVQIGLLTAKPLKKHSVLPKRTTRSVDGQLACRDMKSEGGKYWFKSQGEEEVCGLYLIGLPDQVVEIEITGIDIGCATNGVLAVFDGWELNREVFPSVAEHALTMEERYHTLCGPIAPKRLYVSSQNVALIQFYIPKAGQGFSVNIKFHRNLQPCNVVAKEEQGILTVKNYGERRNCTVSIIYPERITMVNVDVGVSVEKKLPMEAEIGIRKQCSHMAGGDYVELLNGNGLDTDYMLNRGHFCGMKSNGANVDVVLGCQHSVVRMVSSGLFYNTVTFEFAPPSPNDVNSDDIC